VNHDPDNPNDPSAVALARHIESHPASVVMAAARLLGWQLTFDLIPKEHPDAEEGPHRSENPDRADPCCQKTGGRA